MTRIPLRRHLAYEDGFSLIELLAVMVILGFVMTGIISLYLSGTNSQARLSSAFQAQSGLHLALDKMRKDVHLSCSQTAQSATSVTLSETPCDGTVLVTWCTQANGSFYSLYRVSGSSCTGGADWADYLTSGSIFSYLGPNQTNTTPATGSYALPRLHVDMTINPTPTSGSTSFRVVDDLVFLNGARQ